MIINTRWLVENRVIHCSIEGALNVEQLRAGSQQLVQKLEQSNKQPVHIFFDLSLVQSIPLQMGLIGEAVRPFMTHPNTGWIIAFGTQNGMIRMISSIVSQTFRARFRFYPQRDEAIHMLQSLDTTLPDLNVLLAQPEM